MSKTTLITGVSKGIGKSLLNHYLNKNHVVIGVSRTSVDCQHENFLHVMEDINNDVCKEKIVEIIKDKNIDNCILNAGVFKNSFFHKMSYNQWCEVFNTNLISSYNILHPVINNMRNNNKGNIIFLSSVVAKTGTIGASSYSSSKSALYGLTKSLSLENANKNILINSVSPGYFNDGMGLTFDEKIYNDIRTKIPLQRFGDTKELVELFDFLIEKNRYITGNNININGGIY